MFTTKGRYVALAAAAALSVTGVVAVAPAEAATKTVIIWTDGVRASEVKSLLKAVPTGIAGYKWKVVQFATLPDLDKAFANATRATGPDLVFSNSNYANQGAKNGKLIPISLPAAVKSQFTKTSLNTLSYKGLLYGVPLDFDTTALWYNKSLVAAPKTFPEMVNNYKKLKASKGLTAGFCAGDTVWSSQPLFTALGGGAWPYKADGSPDPTKTLMNSATFKANVTKYLVANPNFYKQNSPNGNNTGCMGDFLAGKVPYAQKGPWGQADIKAALGTKWGLTAFPGMTAGTYGNPWGGTQGIYVTVFAANHGVQSGAVQFATKYMSSTKVQLWLANGPNGRVPANQSAAAKVTNPIVKGVAASGSHAIAQLDTYLNSNASGAGWYDTVNAAFKAILEDGKPVGATLDNLASKLLVNFKAAK